MKKLNKYKIFITIYSVILVIIMIFSLTYVYVTLINYEKNQPKSYIKNLINKVKNNPSKYLDIKDEYVEGYKNILKEKIEIEELDDNSYQILADGSPIFNVKLNKGESINKLVLLNYNLLSLNEIKTTDDKGAYYYKIKVPSSFTVKVNGDKIDEVLKKEIIEEFEDIDNENFPVNHIYEISGLSNKPNIEIYNNNGDLVKAEIVDGYITSYEFYKTNDYKKYLKNSIDVLKFAKNWSLFLTNDLKGNGLNILKPYLIKDNRMYTFAKDWATGIDKTFVSTHRLKNPTFTNESVTDCVIYSNTAFSCLVKLEKNMVVSGKDKVDTLNDRMFFVNDNGWKFVDMVFVSE